MTHALVRIKKLKLCLKFCNIIASEQRCSYNEDDESGHYGMGCHGKKSPELYNAAFFNAFLSVHNERSFVIKTRGRSDKEEGFIWVEKGKFLGYVYIPEDSLISYIEDIKNFIEPCYDTQAIIDNHMKKA